LTRALARNPRLPFPHLNSTCGSRVFGFSVAQLRTYLQRDISPSLRLRHLFVFIFAVAVQLACLRILDARYASNEPYRTRTLVFNTLSSIIYAAGLAYSGGVLLCMLQGKRDCLREPGHWLLVGLGIQAISGWLYWTALEPVLDTESSLSNIAARIAVLGCVRTLPFVIAVLFFTRSTTWRVTLTVLIVSNVVCTASRILATYAMYSHEWDRLDTIIQSVAPSITLIWMWVVAMVTWRQTQFGRQLHLIGVSCYSLSLGLRLFAVFQSNVGDLLN